MYGRPGPAYLDLPDDVITGRVDEAEVQIGGDDPAAAPQPGAPTATSTRQWQRCAAPNGRS